MFVFTFGNGSNAPHEIQQLGLRCGFTEILCGAIGSPSHCQVEKQIQLHTRFLIRVQSEFGLPFARNLSSCRMQTAFRQSIDASISVQSVNIFRFLLLIYIATTHKIAL